MNPSEVTPNEHARPNQTPSDFSRNSNDGTPVESCSTGPACPVCGGKLIDIRAKLQCSRCHTICETCCEGGPG